MFPLLEGEETGLFLLPLGEGRGEGILASLRLITTRVARSLR